MTFAIYSKTDNAPTRVLYSHLTEKTAEEVVDRMNSNLLDRGVPACVWYEQHDPQAVFVIGSRTESAYQ